MKTMMKYMFFILLSGKLLSCNNNIQTNEQSNSSKSSDTSKPTVPETTEKSDEDQAGCYMKIVGRDTAIVMLEQKGKEFSGKMIYDHYEKDGSRGIIKVK